LSEFLFMSGFHFNEMLWSNLGNENILPHAWSGASQCKLGKAIFILDIWVHGMEQLIILLVAFLKVSLWKCF